MGYRRECRGYYFYNFLEKKSVCVKIYHFHEKNFIVERGGESKMELQKVSNNTIVFLTLYMDNILLMENDMIILQIVNVWLSRKFSTFKNKIYKDKSKKLIHLIQSTYIDKILKIFSMKQLKKGYFPMTRGIILSRNTCSQRDI